MINFCEIPEFKKDIEGLPYPSLSEDLRTLRQAINVEPRGRPPQIVRVPLGSLIEVEVYKVKHFRCKSLQGKGSRSGIRVVYAHIPDKNEIIFIEAYFKKDDSTDCDKKRIEKYFNKTNGLYYTAR